MPPHLASKDGTTVGPTPPPTPEGFVYVGPLRFQITPEVIYISVGSGSRNVMDYVGLLKIREIQIALEREKTPHQVYTRKDPSDPTREIPDTIILAVK